jgi:hypothetical protein
MSLLIPHWLSLRLSSGIKHNNTCTSVWKTVTVDIYRALQTTQWIQLSAAQSQMRKEHDEMISKPVGKKDMMLKSRVSVHSSCCMQHSLPKAVTDDE